MEQQIILILKLLGLLFILIGIGLILFSLLSYFNIILFFKRSYENIKDRLNRPRNINAIRNNQFYTPKPDRIPLPWNDDSGLINLDELSSIIAHNIWLNCTNELLEDVATEKPLDLNYDPQTKIDSLDKLYFFSWIQIFVKENNIFFLQNKKKDLEKKIFNLFEKATFYIEPNISSQFSPVIDIYYEYESLKLGQSEFALNLLPCMPPLPKATICEGYIYTGISNGNVQTPGCNKKNIKVGSIFFSNRQNIYPFSNELGKTIVIGPEPWCHIKINRNILDNVLILGWSKPTDIDVIGKIELLEKCPSDLYIKKGNQCYPFDRSNNTIIFNQADDKPTTKWQIIKKQENKEYKIINIFFANPFLKLESLPECVVCSNNIDRIFKSKDKFCKFILTQIYIQSKKNKDLEKAQLLFLDDQAGINKDDQNFQVKGDELCSVIKIGFSSTKKLLVQDILETYKNEIFETIQKIIKLDIYKEAFAEGIFKEEEFIFNIFFDKMIPGDSIIFRIIPVIKNDHRGKVYGKIDLTNWDGIKDISTMSINPENTAFFIENPPGNIRCRISCFPIYGLHSSKIKGVVSINLFYLINNEKEVIIKNQTSHSIFIDIGDDITPQNEEIEPQDVKTVLFSDIKESNTEWKSFFLILDNNKLEVKIYNKPIEQQYEEDFKPRPGKILLYGGTLSKKMDRNNWDSDESDFYKLFNSSNIKREEIEGVSQVSENAYLAIISKDIEEEAHLFAGQKTSIEYNNCKKEIQKWENTLNILKPYNISQMKIQDEFLFNIYKGSQDKDEGKIYYYRNNPNEAKYAKILYIDFEEYLYDHCDLSQINDKIKKIDILRCHPKYLEDKDQHLYYILTERNEGWLFHKQKGIKGIGRIGKGLRYSLEYEKELVGPLRNIEGLFWVNWEGEDGTLLSFDIENHQTQIDKYISQGFFSIDNEISYYPGGDFNLIRQKYNKPEENIISDREFFLKDEKNLYLSFNPRDYVNFYDKDSFSISFNKEEGKYVVISRCHKKLNVEPKTVFMVVPKGGIPILGSHAIPYIPLDQGESFIVLPGLTFKFSYGVNYYIN